MEKRGLEKRGLVLDLPHEAELDHGVHTTVEAALENFLRMGGRTRRWVYYSQRSQRASRGASVADFAKS